MTALYCGIKDRINLFVASRRKDGARSTREVFIDRSRSLSSPDGEERKAHSPFVLQKAATIARRLELHFSLYTIFLFSMSPYPFRVRNRRKRRCSHVNAHKFSPAFRLPLFSLSSPASASCFFFFLFPFSLRAKRL